MSEIFLQKKNLSQINRSVISCRLINRAQPYLEERLTMAKNRSSVPYHFHAYLYLFLLTISNDSKKYTAWRG